MLMKIRNLLLFTICSLYSLTCFAQGSSDSVSTQVKITRTYDPITPYFVLKVDKKTVGISKALGDDFDLGSIDPESIKKIDVLKGENAINKYGVLGENGVVIITFKNYATLPQELKDRFKDSK